MQGSEDRSWTLVVPQAYHDKLTTLVTTTVVKEGAAYLADLHHDHARPEFQSGNLLRVGAKTPVVSKDPVEAARARESSGVLRELSPVSSHRAESDKPTDLLSLIGLDSEELGASGLFTFDLPAPQFHAHGALESADPAEVAFALSDIREDPVDTLLSVHLAPAQFHRHGELSSGSESSAAQSADDVQAQGLRALHEYVKLEPVGQAVFHPKGHLSRRQDDDQV